MKNHTTFLRQVFPRPNIVISRKEMHLYPTVRQFANLAQKTGKALGNYGAVFEPEVEHIAQQIHGLSLVLDFVEETHQSAFLLTGMLQSPAAQMGVGEEINGFHDICPCKCPFCE